MAAKDVFHNAVKVGLEKENWMITDDPYKVQVGGVEMYVDLAAERILAAEKQGQKIAVEIKSFINPSAISEFHTAIGQFLNYQVALEEQEPDRILYLAVPQGSYKTFFSLKFVQTVIQRFKIKIIVYDPVDEVIVQWIN
ncbi:XisH family protein [Limnoraphis robusta Tam1]|uniref:XisH family protein n=1 Tax=Limnoraphis robusta TaxID=1118279 RepID=UPI002B207E03|nr:XisH family protein [Limnoraphis robusta]MEA5496135.1 XisH family protein [Limnoraphis robusta BA-68 BA1]MEA5538436.1 XisH family protein [Limnoraphis robusta Tam1]